MDVTDYGGEKFLQPIAEYVDAHTIHIHVKRIDTMREEGWDDDLKVLLHDHTGNIQVVRIGPMTTSNLKRVDDVSLPGFSLVASSRKVEEGWCKSYRPFRQFEHFPSYVGVKHFNELFDADLVELPASMFAVGMKNGGAYIYHDAYGTYPWDYEIKLTIDFILNMMFARTPSVAPPTFYCVICALDGYIETCYASPNRATPRRVGEIECRNQSLIKVDNYTDAEYPVFHKQKYILAQSVRRHIPYTMPVVDRYYLCLNRYNGYRSVHRGIPFHTKKAMVVYAGNDRGSKYNFVSRRDIDVSQRSYFASDKVDKEHVLSTNHIAREEMINYKYILDMDGNACTWDATAWKLNSGSVIFKAESDWVQWFYDKYVPWTHYVPIKDDFSDLQEKFRWCEEHQSACVEMTKNCKALFQEIYREENVVKEMEKVIDVLVEEQKKSAA